MVLSLAHHETGQVPGMGLERCSSFGEVRKGGNWITILVCGLLLVRITNKINKPVARIDVEKLIFI